MALSTARIHRVRGRPPLLAAGIKSLIHSNSSSVRSLGYIFSFIYPFYTTHEDFSDRLSEPLTGSLAYCWMSFGAIRSGWGNSLMICWLSRDSVDKSLQNRLSTWHNWYKV